MESKIQPWTQARVPWFEYTTSADGTRCFTRQAQMLGNAGADKIFSIWSNPPPRKDRQYTRSIPMLEGTTLGMKAGNSVHTTFEFTPEGIEYPYPTFSNMSKEIPWSDRADLLSLGSRHEWQVDGVWECTYQQLPWPGGARFLLDPEDAGSLRYFDFARSLPDTFFGRKYTNAPHWHCSMEVVIYKFNLDFDQMEAEFALQRQEAPIPWPFFEDRDYYISVLESLGARSVGLARDVKNKFSRTDEIGNFLKYEFSSADPSVRALGPGPTLLPKGNPPIGKARHVNCIGHPGRWMKRKTQVIYDLSPPYENKLVHGWLRPDQWCCDLCYDFLWPNGAHNPSPYLEEKTPPANPFLQ